MRDAGEGATHVVGVEDAAFTHRLLLGGLAGPR
jgi:hypothetical protein